MSVLSMTEDDLVLTYNGIFNITYIQSVTLRKTGWYLGLEELEITTLMDLQDWVHMRLEECYQEAEVVRVIFSICNQSLRMQVYVFDGCHDFRKPAAELFFKPRTDGGKEIVKELKLNMKRMYGSTEPN